MQTETKTVYAYDADGKYVTALVLDHTDRSQNSGAWQIPAQCTEIEPPTEKEGFDRFFGGVAWEYREQPKQEEPETTKPEQPAEQPHETVDPTILALAEAVAAQEARLTVLEGGEKA